MRLKLQRFEDGAEDEKTGSMNLEADPGAILGGKIRFILRLRTSLSMIFLHVAHLITCRCLRAGAAMMLCAGHT